MLQPAVSAFGSKAVAVHTLLQERKSSLHTRTLWLPAPQADGLGAIDCAGGIGFPVEGVCVPCCWAMSAVACMASRRPKAKIATLVMSITHPRSVGWPTEESVL